MPNDNIMGIPTKACINGITKADALEIKKIPTLESETNEIINDTIPSLNERITALEQGSISSIQYQDIIYSFQNLVYDENKISKTYLKNFKYYIPNTKLNEIYSALEEYGEFQDDLFDIKVETGIAPFPILTGKIKKDVLICINFNLFPNSFNYLYNNFSLTIVIKKDTDFTNFTYIQIGNFEYSIASTNLINCKNIKLENIGVYPLNPNIVFYDIVSTVTNDNIWLCSNSEYHDDELININPNGNENFGIFIIDNLYSTEEYN